MKDNYNLDIAISEIRKTNNIILDKNDPVCALYTMLEILFKNSTEEQKDLLAGFKSELEIIANQQANNSKDLIEKGINATINASKKVSSDIIEKAADEMSNVVKNEIAKVIESEMVGLKRISRSNKIHTIANIVISASILITAIVINFSR